MAKKEKDVDPFDFVNQWHQSTIKEGKAYKHPDGKVTTVMTVGVPHPDYPDEIFMVPAYLKDEGKILSEGEAYNYWKNKIPKLIEQGKLSGFKTEGYIGPVNKHPANIAAQQNHKKIEGPVPDTAIKYNFYNPNK